MVRLKDHVVHIDRLQRHAFQFHYGTIKSHLQSNSLSSVLYFNSTMVRLKASAQRQRYEEAGHFNSTMVRLKVSIKVLSWLLKLHFNSTMVRLKALPTILPHIASPISIPLWYD